MSRRRRAEKREIASDPLYKSEAVARFVNCLMIGGKRSLAQRILYSAMEDFKKKIQAENILEAFEQALENAKPFLEVKSRRIGGATFQVPVEIAPSRRASLAMRWIITNAKNKPGRSMIQGLSMELSDCYQNQGSTIKKKEEVHRMAEANRAFAHYK